MNPTVDTFSAMSKTDPDVFDAVSKEIERQKNTIILIASENYPSKAVLEAQGSVLTNKYAEGYPGKRYYGGCEFVDVTETLAIDRAKKLFSAEHVNVQPHSGAQANMAAYFSMLQPEDCVLGMRLDQGGHLTHGSQVNFSGKLYKFVAYGVDRETELIDYDEVLKLAKENKPKLIVTGYTAYPRVIDFQRFRSIADEVGAKLMTDMAHIAGLIAAGVHPSCVPYSDVVTATTHKTLRGPRGGMILSKKELGQSIDKSVFPSTQGGPLMHAVAAKAICFGEAMQPEFAEYGRNIVENARTLANELQGLGLRIVSGGTDNHLLLVDLSPLSITGKEAEEALSRVNIVLNRNAIPYDTKPPRVTSGLRIGTAAVTSRAFGAQEMKLIAEIIVDVLTHLGNSSTEKAAKDKVSQITNKFPVPG